MDNQSYSFERITDKESQLTKLVDLVERFRKNVEIAWSKNTKYPNSEGDGRFDPLGQCAVSTRLLKDILATEFGSDFVTEMHLGHIITNENNKRKIYQNHVWLEIQMGG